MMKLIERLTTVAVLIAAVLVIGVTVRDRIYPVQSAGPSAALNAAQQLVGKQFPLPDKSETGKSATLLLVVASGCHFCSESMPFYRQLTGMKPAASGNLGILAVMPQTSGEAREYLSENHLNVDGIVSTPLPKVGLQATPTLVLLDGNRQVKAIWVGLLDARRQGEVVKKIRELCRNCVAA